jgi:hypothetical protein
MELEEYKNTARYGKMRERDFYELGGLLQDLHAGNVASQKKALSRLSHHARKELGWNCFPVREWLTENILALLSEANAQQDAKLLTELLRVLGFFYERYVTHPVWVKLRRDVFDTNFTGGLRVIAEKYRDHSSSLIREQVANIMAQLGDGRAWDIYNELLQKRASVVGWLGINLSKQGQATLSKEQANALLTTLNAVTRKTKNPSVRRIRKRGGAKMRGMCVADSAQCKVARWHRVR